MLGAPQFIVTRVLDTYICLRRLLPRQSKIKAPPRLQSATALSFRPPQPYQTGRCGYRVSSCQGYTLANPTVKAVRRFLARGQSS